MYANGIRKETETLQAEGVTLLSFWRTADTEAGHVATVLTALDLPEGARVVDIGSGTGAFAKYAHGLRPDLHFVNVNDDAWQLSCSESAERVLSDMADTGLPDASFDAVILAYTLGHGDAADTLEEAHRLLKVGGKLFLHDITATHIGATRVRAVLDYTVHMAPLLQYWAEIIGFDAQDGIACGHLAQGGVVRRAVDSGLLDGVQPVAAVFVKTERPHRFKGRRVALQFSGGKDSTACIYLLKPFIKKFVTLYWLNTGDGIPETREVVDAIRAEFPVTEIRTDVKTWREQNGMPSDLVPARAHTIGMMYGMSDVKVSNRFDCCYANLMLPMHQRAIDDGIDLIIRGTKTQDTGRVPLNGWDGGVEVWLPLLDFSHEDVFTFLHDCGAPVAECYAFFKGISAPECLGCTAWWDDGKAAYLKDRHPQQFATYRGHLQRIAGVVAHHLSEMYSELGD